MYNLARFLELALASIAALLLAGYIYERLAERRDANQHRAPGRLIGVGDHRLHILCQGSGSFTVVIEQGAGSPSRLWWPLQAQIAALTRVCTYDRAGYCWSEPANQPGSICQRSTELHSLLTLAEIPGPYLLVGHSYGGLIIRQFALRFPAETAGLILVDTPDELSLSEPEVQMFYARIRLFVRVLKLASHIGLPRLLRHIPALKAGLWFVHPKENKATLDDLASLKKMDSSPPIPGALGDLPLFVITHGLPFPGPFAVLEKGWIASQHRLAALSSRATLTTALESNHMIHLDQPDLVLEAIQTASAQAALR